jgi:soluble lytic murein transglycosylase-like protein
LPTAADQQAYAQWQAASSQRLKRYKKHPTERQEFLQTLWYEARRAGLPLSLVLGVVQVESAFRKFAISSAGARGYMQVMPFWARLIGDGDDSRLFHMQTNLRFGCVILRHYLDRERGDMFMALGRYNGSRGQSAYPQSVMAAQRDLAAPLGLRAQKSHPRVAVDGWRPRLRPTLQAWPLMTCCSSPDSYISIMMSEPPMNSPLT